MTCLDDDTVLGLVEGRIIVGEAIDVHLDSCASCRDVVSQVAKARVPERVGGYVLGELLGIGAMGRVYAAVQPGLDRSVAIKLMPGADLREAQAMARINHPNVMTVHEVGTTDDGVFVVMELVDGRDLRAWLGRPWRDLVPLLVDVARGLAAVHAAGVLHRDVKPDNIIVGADRRARLGDFGLAALEGGTTSAGTPAYMAPELLAGGAATAASDQFSFGVTAYELLAGARPYARLADGTEPAILAGPRWLDAALRRCLARDPGARFPEMAEVARLLADRSSRRRPAAWIATGLALAAVASAATFYLARSPEPPPPPAPSSLSTALLAEAKILRSMERFDAAATTAREALATAERDHDDRAASEAWVLRVAIAGARRDLAAAEDLGEVAAGAIDRAGAPPSLVTELAHQRGMIAYNRGDLPKAKKLLQTARSRSVGNTGEHTLAVAAIDSALGSIARATGDLDAAERHHRAALAIDRELHGEVSRDLHNLAGVLRLRGDLDAAAATYREALALESGVEAGLTHNSLALVEMAREHWPAARLELDEARALLAEHGDLGLVEHNLGLVAMATDNRAAAREHYARAAEIYARTIGPDAELAIRLRADRASADDRPVAAKPTHPKPVEPEPRDVGAYGARQPW